ncbi:histidine kinase dimerization/phospho-acceptor domain-containing protein [Accumulibacter sp.]|uniref:histidine kinase dimerization/phospho-acceptor domain-containing protein n=1 Tax=Accumulibacter sp. TaxID=2053492 RepID=UPI0035B3E6F8
MAGLRWPGRAANPRCARDAARRSADRAGERAGLSATPSTGTRQRAFVRLGWQSSAGGEPHGSDGRGSAAAALQPADQSGGAITRLLAAASHDLRQPLQAIGLWVALLREQAQDPKVRDILGKVQTTAQGAAR